VEAICDRYTGAERNTGLAPRQRWSYALRAGALALRALTVPLGRTDNGRRIGAPALCRRRRFKVAAGGIATWWVKRRSDQRPRGTTPPSRPPFCRTGRCRRRQRPLQASRGGM